MPNFVQIYATLSELWAINGIQNGGRCHFKFITIATFGHISIFCNGWLHSCKIILIYLKRQLSY